MEERKSISYLPQSSDAIYSRYDVQVPKLRSQQPMTSSKLSRRVTLSKNSKSKNSSLIQQNESERFVLPQSSTLEESREESSLKKEESTLANVRGLQSGK